MVEAACGVFQSASAVLLGGGAAGIRVVDARTGLRFAAGSFAVHSRGGLLGVFHGLAVASGGFARWDVVRWRGRIGWLQ
jgi:hypothetical protein